MSVCKLIKHVPLKPSWVYHPVFLRSASDQRLKLALIPYRSTMTPINVPIQQPQSRHSCTYKIQNIVPHLIKIQNIVPHLIKIQNIVSHLLQIQNIVPHLIKIQNIVPHLIQIQNIVPHHT